MVTPICPKCKSRGECTHRGDIGNWEHFVDEYAFSCKNCGYTEKRRVDGGRECGDEWVTHCPYCGREWCRDQEEQLIITSAQALSPEMLLPLTQQEDHCPFCNSEQIQKDLLAWWNVDDWGPLAGPKEDEWLCLECGALFDRETRKIRILISKRWERLLGRREIRARRTGFSLKSKTLL